MVPVIHALGQVVFSKLFAGFFVGPLQKRLPSGTTAMQTGMVWALTSWRFTSATSKAMLAALMHLFLKPASASDAQHKDSSSLIDSYEACSEWNPSWKTSVWPWPLYCNSVSGCYRTSYSFGHLCGERNTERIVLKEPNLNCSKTRYTNVYSPVKQLKTWTWWMGHGALHG